MNEYMNKALEIINEWNAKSGEERYDFCRNCPKVNFAGWAIHFRLGMVQ